MKKSLLQFLLVVALIFAAAGSVFAATINLGVSKTSVVEGEAFTATVSVNTQGVAVNNAEGVISFPANLVSVESVNLNGSIFSIWVEQPTYSNTTGTISFNGGSPNPGYTGTSGTIMRVVFRAKKSGVVPLSFTSADVYANDGLGTNVTSGRIASPNVQITTKKQIEVEEPVEVAPTITKVPSALVVTSADAPDPDSWYSKDALTFAWNLPVNATSVQLGWGRNATGAPTVSYTPPIKERTIRDIPEGVWYIHARVRNVAGWSPVTHRKFSVDLTVPQDISVEVQNTETGQIELSVNAKDTLSGIARYTVSIGTNTYDVTPVNGSVGKITLPRLPAGEQILVVSAFDKAGNTARKEIVIQSPQVNPPVITEYPITVEKNESISISGTAYPNVKIAVRATSLDGRVNTETVTTNSTGVFTATFESAANDGVIIITAQIEENGVAISSESNSVSIEVKKSFFSLDKLPTLPVIDTRFIVIAVSALVFLLLVGVCVGFYKFHNLHRKLRNDVDGLRNAIINKTLTPEETAALHKIIRDLE